MSNTPVWMYGEHNDTLFSLPGVVQAFGPRVVVRAITIGEAQNQMRNRGTSAIVLADSASDALSAVAFEVVALGTDVPLHIKVGMHVDIVSGAWDGVDPRKVGLYMHVHHEDICAGWKPEAYEKALTAKYAVDAATEDAAKKKAAATFA